MSEKIVLTFTLTTKEQAAAMIEAYGQVLNSGAEAVMTIQGPSVAPAAPNTPPPPPAATNVDTNGTPWNPELHAPSRSITAKGDFMNKKGVSKEAVAAWKTQHARPAAPASPPPAPTAPALNAQFGAPALPTSAGHPPVNYATFAALYAKLAQAGKINGDHVAKIMEDSQTADAAEYAKNDAKRAHAFALLKTYDV